jgi:hypothetical protein
LKESELKKNLKEGEQGRKHCHLGNRAQFQLQGSHPAMGFLHLKSQLRGLAIHEEVGHRSLWGWRLPCHLLPLASVALGVFLLFHKHASTAL